MEPPPSGTGSLNNSSGSTGLEKITAAQVVDLSPVPTFVIDINHRITHWNRACACLTGYPASAIVGTQDQWRPFYPSPRPVMADILLKGGNETEFKALYEGKYRRSHIVDGAFEGEDFFPHFGTQGRWLYFTAALLRDKNGQVTGAIETLQDISARKRIELALQQSEERYRQLSVTDGLTGLGNLRSCYENLEKEMSRSRRYQSPLSCLMFDVDNFKNYNDSWGHMEGDMALKSMAACITRNLRATDSAYRYGGEEFVILLPETPLEQATVLADRIRQDYACTQLRPAEGIVVCCTVSIGAAELTDNDNAKEFLRRADHGTYQAKSIGKNRVVSIPAPSKFN